MKKQFLILLLILIILSGCLDINTNDPEKAFRYWTHIPLPNSEVKALKGRYWQSNHFTLEYEVYLQLVASDEWREELIRFNDLVVDTTSWYCPKDVPNWFFPSDTLIQYQSRYNSLFRLWMRHNGDTVYIYDLQL